ncbi:hypothetical protein PMAYCL1PPCAC_32668 [Pristionchus mayeri]|uniref:Uncharacterized protein n=1 Tax=Pristionchus mayeri TaxID=1317129 RepID=A0AAN5IDN2_9BILA|nr:hypothetical protein PMAYCL1PPCAC_32668 [Pristionchus mayeri]
MSVVVANLLRKYDSSNILTPCKMRINIKIRDGIARNDSLQTTHSLTNQTCERVCNMKRPFLVKPSQIKIIKKKRNVRCKMVRFQHPPFLLAVATNRFFGAYAGKHVTLPPNLGRFLIANRRFTLDQDDQDDTAKRLRTESPVESEDELPTDESTFIVTQNEEKEKSDDDDHYEF